MPTGKIRNKGFTLIELLVVLALIALLAGLVIPSAVSALGKSKESALKQDLFSIRKALDDFYSDNGKYPETLQALVDGKYLRKIPADPFTDSNTTWVTVISESGDSPGGIADVKSGAEGKSADGEEYQEW